MDCILCSSVVVSSTSSSSSSSSTSNAKNVYRNDLGILNGQKSIRSLCQLLDLPSQIFQNKFLQPNIGFCSSCSISLSTIGILFDQLEQLQTQISEVRGRVKQQMFDALEKYNDLSLEPSSCHILRTEISKVMELWETNSSKSNFHEDDEDDYIIPEQILYMETEPDEEINTTMDSDNGNEMPDMKFENESINPNSSPKLTRRGERKRKPTSKAIVAMKQRIRDGKQLRVSLRRLEPEREGQNETNQNPKQKFALKLRSPTTRNTRKKEISDEPSDSEPESLTKKGRKSKIKRDDVERTVPCTFEDCLDKFKSVRPLRYHLRVHHGVKPKPRRKPQVRQCPHCPKTFKRTKELDIHVRIHTGEAPFVCEICGKCFRCAKFLKSHQIKHKSESDRADRRPRSYRCPDCSVACSSNANLLIHISRIHTGERNFICELCSETFVRKPDLKNHQIRSHADELNLEPFKCKVCDKIYATKYYLIEHEKLHNVDARVSCTLCSFRCERPNRLRLHMKSHSEERPFECTQCDKTYKYKAQLDIHLMGHRGEKPFLCQSCPKAFTELINLKNHEGLHTEINTFKCHLCPKSFPIQKYLTYHLKKNHIPGKIPRMRKKDNLKVGQGQTKRRGRQRSKKNKEDAEGQETITADLDGEKNEGQGQNEGQHSNMEVIGVVVLEPETDPVVIEVSGVDLLA